MEKCICEPGDSGVAVDPVEFSVAVGVGQRIWYATRIDPWDVSNDGVVHTSVPGRRDPTLLDADNDEVLFPEGASVPSIPSSSMAGHGMSYRSLMALTRSIALRPISSCCAPPGQYFVLIWSEIGFLTESQTAFFRFGCTHKVFLYTTLLDISNINM